MEGNGYVLAGGRSARMGQDKAFLPWRGRPLIDRAVSLLEALSLHVYIVCGSPRQARAHQGSTLVDCVPGCGPMGGILSALLHSRTTLNCVIPCDMPLLSGDLLSGLARFCGDFDVVVPGDARGLPQPVVGFYSRRCIPAIEQRIQQGRLSLIDLTRSSRLRVKVVSEEEAGWPAGTFLNLNDPRTVIESQEPAERPSVRPRERKQS